METLYNVLYKMFSLELINLNIGYSFNSNSLFQMNEIINAIDLIKHSNVSNEEIIKIIQYYEEL